jgi:anaerobic dimethyl sulfoxide reductase subunit A
MSKNEDGFSRRSFLKWSAVAAGLTGGLTACGGDSSDDTIVAGGGGGSVDAPDPILQGGKWVTVPCTSCSQFRCVNRAYMVDGIAVRQKTQDDHEHTKDYPTFRACLRGRAARWSVLSPSRLKYPMKRKNWTPGDPGSDPASISAMKTPHLRGKDEWERISWEDAIRYV